MLALLHGERGVLTFEDTFKELSNGQEYPKDGNSKPLNMSGYLTRRG
jgi:hypothetical protein